MSGRSSQAKNSNDHGRIRDGYPALSSWMCQDPDDEGFIFRRFSQLSARNLLNLQSQLIAIEQQLEALDEVARQNHDVGLRRWETFEEQTRDPTNEQAQKRKALYDALEGKIKTYHEALVLQARIFDLRHPRTCALAAFQEWFSGDSGDKGIILNGRAMTMLDNPQDLVALRTPVDEDALTRLLQNHWPFPGYRLDGSKTTSYFREYQVMIVVAVINVLTAATLLVGAIVGLYVVQDPGRRLAMIAGFTAVFTVTVALMTNARRAEVFAATAAYAAVLVVFCFG